MLSPTPRVARNCASPSPSVIAALHRRLGRTTPQGSVKGWDKGSDGFIRPDRWRRRVVPRRQQASPGVLSFNAQAVKPEGGFCPAAGSGAALRRKAAAIGQRRPRGLGIARSLIRFFDTLRPELLISEAPQPRRPR